MYVCFVAHVQIILLIYFNILCSSCFSQDELGCRVDFLLERCFKTEREEMETMENVNKLLLQNVLPLHVASFFMGKTIRNQVKENKTDCKMSIFLKKYRFCGILLLVVLLNYDSILA